MTNWILRTRLGHLTATTQIASEGEGSRAECVRGSSAAKNDLGQPTCTCVVGESLPGAKALVSTTPKLLVQRHVRSNRVLILRREKNHLDGLKEPAIVPLVSVVPGAHVVDGVELVPPLL